MRIGVISPNRLLRESIASLLANETDWIVESAESVRSIAGTDTVAAPRIVVVDGNGLSIDDANFLLGATAFGCVAPIIFGQLIEPYPGLGPVVPSDAPAQELLNRVRALAEPVEIQRMRIPKNCDNEFGLTAREYEVAKLVARGLSNQKIAESLALKDQSVRNMVGVIMMKLRCDNRTQVALQLTGSRNQLDPS